tara:strand:- start:1001 stop:1276 length:276 start_codon:yes stop_codon:yes gene_type:complete
VEYEVAKVEIYSSIWCPFCYRAKRLLEQKGVDYKEIEVSDNPNLKSEMLSRSDGRYTVPQIFIDGKGIGGSDELVALDQKGKLDSILGLDD